MAAPGWHPDPFGRHEHRFFDGNQWTEHVSNRGTATTDPVGATDQAPPPGGAPPGSGPPAWEATATPAAPEAGAKKGGPLLLIGAAVVVALVVAVAAVLLLRDSGGGTGDGDFSLTVNDEEATAHKLNLKAGDFVVIRVEGNDVRAAFGIAKDTFDKIEEAEFVTDADESAIDNVSDFYSDVATDIDTDTAPQELPGFDGVVGDSFFFNDSVAEDFVLAPVSGTYYVLLLSDGGEEEVDLKVRIQDNPDVDSDLSSDDLTDLDTDVYTDFLTDVDSEFSDDTDDSDS